MRSDLLGRIRNTHLSLTHGLLPVYEAIVNSIDSTEERADNGAITIRIEREPMLFEENQHGNTIADIIAFEVEDNGIGFTSENFRSFETLDSRAKVERGGKGVGRILWLCAFSSATVDSIYKENGQYSRRRFVFRLSDQGVEEHINEELSGAHSPRTIVKLAGFKSQYQSHVRKSLSVIARQILDHTLEYFVLERAPQISVVDTAEGEVEQLNTIFREEYRPRAQTRAFEIGDYEFTLMDVLLDAEASSPSHSLNFCAHNRVVKTISLSEKLIANLEQTIEFEEGHPVVYAAYVRSPFLDDKVNQERTGFQIDNGGDLPFAGGPTWDQIQTTSLALVAQYLEEPTTSAKERNINRIQDFIENYAPKYRLLLNHCRDEVSNIPSSATGAKLDVELHKILSSWKTSLREKAAIELSEDAPPPGQDIEHDEQRARLISQLTESMQSDLAEYVLERHSVLSLFRKLLGSTEAGRFPLEDELHRLFYPMKTTSNEVDYDAHNLWIIDERLAYHSYLASDLQLRSQNGPVESNSQDRPDLIIYNRSMAYSADSLPTSSVVIVEFKRPERDDYDEGDGPILQVIRYVNDIRQGRARRDDGSTITVGDNLPFYCHVIATLTPRLRQDANERGFIQTPDGNGYFLYNPNIKAYIEIVSFQKVLDDAIRRNRIFFDKLGLTIR